MKHINDFADHLTSLSYRDDTRKFLNGILTEAEQKDIGNRWQIWLMIKAGYSLRQICDRLEVDKTTVVHWKKKLMTEKG